ncbi:MAG: glycosyltransferase family 4 protein [Spirochaetaceae bacterium]|nr:glycosyltransferase family 4 protein [Spirochaetaceae bacterium]
MPIKILIIIPNITRSAGTERAVCNLANILSKSEKYQLTILSIKSANGNPYYQINNKVKIIHCAVSVKNKLLKRIQEYRKVKNICDSGKFDIAIGTYSAINTQLPFIRSIKKKIAAEHINYDYAPFFPKIVRRIFYSLLDAVVLLTTADAVNYKFHKNVVVIPNSLSFIPKKQSLLENKTILSIGRLAYQKGFDRLIAAIALIKEKCLDWQVRIIGNGEDKDKLKKQIENCGLKEIISIIPPTDKIEEEYYNAAIYVMSSRYEGLPMVLIEAKSCGLPIVSFNCPEGPSDIILDGINGFLIEKDNVELLSKAIITLIENEELRKQFGKEATRDIDRFKPEHIGLLWEKLFNNLLDIS